MRTVLLFLIAAIPLGGCSSVMPKSGNGLSELTTREKVRAKLGTPVATGTADGQEYDEFRDSVLRETATTGIPRVSDATFHFFYDPVGRVTSAYADVDERVRLATSQELSTQSRNSANGQKQP